MTVGPKLKEGFDSNKETEENEDTLIDIDDILKKVKEIDEANADKAKKMAEEEAKRKAEEEAKRKAAKKVTMQVVFDFLKKVFKFTFSVSPMKLAFTFIIVFGVLYFSQEMLKWDLKRHFVNAMENISKILLYVIFFIL